MNTQTLKELEELTIEELEKIDGGSWAGDLGSWLGRKTAELFK
ncbi:MULTISPECIES: ComC/BlpC family leader-containing pheromone/bacteriocin [Bacillus cereus group]|nr:MULTISPECIES: ComC/BlpC family leader-containing pheromone/bacteriocin [Bacillus cereus group]PEC51247.1 ComC/BlpC family peptide pheromone/bacteriocin [Bacillus cereus]PEK09974.1 ComC/BlpC family peptide pheromone/bacteriocin [Bacillus toyonensis]PGA53001.1 ComC/BlpC family peptide pheromone/bacteriocin [Bacillus toyonensis]PGB97462.1 ComC/BlpC family peptide pheromone/bacteriocin [Bacillus toyonensis]PGU48417.1 ComC/BlpC family peptide pheromone/bacteriocin [Bacillus cereus]